MKKTLLTASITAMGMAIAAPAAAQDMPMGAEIYGQTVNVEFADGTENNVYFNRDGTATIRSMDGMTMPATWSVANGDLCLMAGGDQECWDYDNRFVANSAMPMVSSCGVASTWTALGVNAPPPVRVAPTPAPAPAPAPAPVYTPAPQVGERG